MLVQQGRSPWRHRRGVFHRAHGDAPGAELVRRKAACLHGRAGMCWRSTRRRGRWTKAWPFGAPLILPAMADLQATAYLHERATCPGPSRMAVIVGLSFALWSRGCCAPRSDG